MISRLINRIVWLVALFLIAAGAVAAQGQAPQPGRFTLDQFRGLRFVEGSWVGSGYSKPFFERYTFVNDSTLQMTGYTDSTFTTPSGSGTYSFRNGVVRTDEGAALIRIDSLGYHFSTLGARPSPWVFRRITADRWTATLGAGARPTIYTMDRARRR